MLYLMTWRSKHSEGGTRVVLNNRQYWLNIGKDKEFLSAELQCAYEEACSE
jgi:hypothetical protein